MLRCSKGAGVGGWYAGWGSFTRATFARLPRKRALSLPGGCGVQRTIDCEAPVCNLRCLTLGEVVMGDVLRVGVLIILLLGPPLAIVLAVLVWRERRKRVALETKFKDVVEAEALAAEIVSGAEARAKELEIKSELETLNIQKLRAEYAEKKKVYDRILQEVAVFDERLAFAEMGVYEPHFDFTDSSEYKDAISLIRDKQKAMVAAKSAVTCATSWSVDGSQSKGKTMTNRNIRLTLRAFNGECDAAISNVRWNNVNAMEKRIGQVFSQIEKLNESNAVHISQDYLKLKFEELFLAHEYREKLKHEKEERAEAARLSREEQKLLRDLESAEEDETRYQRLLAKAKAEATAVTGQKLSVFTEQIRLLEKELAEAHAKVERAQAMAEKTRTGYVYIISNIGSFGEGVVKIGLTRRLDPSDRVRELGDASVPFLFDTHAMIYSDDAPSLERALHSEFESGRVNGSNYRKEFFRASVDEVGAAVARLAPGAAFFRDIEAQEFRETMARRKAELISADVVERTVFPAEI